MKGKNRYAKNICILVLGIISFVLLCLLAKNYSLPFLQEIDAKILQFMVGHTNRNMTAVMSIITFFGTIGGVTLILILMILISRFQKEMLLYSVLVLFTYLINGFIKNIVIFGIIFLLIENIKTVPTRKIAITKLIIPQVVTAI